MTKIRTIEEASIAINTLQNTVAQLKAQLSGLKQLNEQQLAEAKRLLGESEKAQDFAIHAYRVDHNGWIWKWDVDSQEYSKTNCRVSTPEVPDESITERKIAPSAVTNSKIGGEAVTNDKMAKNSVNTTNLVDKSVTEPKIGDKAVIRRVIGDKAIGEDQLDELAVKGKHIANHTIPLIKILPNDMLAVVYPFIQSYDQKFTDITNELYDAIRALQVGGVALSQQFGDRTDIGISQKTLTKALGKFWEKMEEITGETYMDFTLTVTPQITYSESTASLTITADCSDAISNFDSIKIYADDELIAESSDVSEFTISHIISNTTVIRAVGVILGKTFTKTFTAIKEVPFFMGSGEAYTDIVNETCRKELVGTLEGDYDVTVEDNKYIFIIIPYSKREEFRRANMSYGADMNGFEIPLNEPVELEEQDMVVYQSVNRYEAGSYNIDININS